MGTDENQLKQDVKNVASDVMAEANQKAQSELDAIKAKSLPVEQEAQSLAQEAESFAHRVWTTERDHVFHTILTLKRSEDAFMEKLQDAKNLKKLYFALGFVSGIALVAGSLLALPFLMRG